MQRDEAHKKVAEAIATEFGYAYDKLYPELDQGRALSQRQCDQVADAAIIAFLDAVREPSEYMLRHGTKMTNEHPEGRALLARGLWRHMCDALKAELEKYMSAETARWEWRVELRSGRSSRWRAVHICTTPQHARQVMNKQMTQYRWLNAGNIRVRRAERATPHTPAAPPSPPQAE